LVLVAPASAGRPRSLPRGRGVYSGWHSANLPTRQLRAAELTRIYLTEFASPTAINPVAPASRPAVAWVSRPTLCQAGSNASTTSYAMKRRPFQAPFLSTATAINTRPVKCRLTRRIQLKILCRPCSPGSFFAYHYRWKAHNVPIDSRIDRKSAIASPLRPRN
jgi:hypothetical protein